ncbi:MAG: argininosuccinate lyase, partial [Oscillospiraceae bacterium]|nr:argininosuccinate lyase [Oscillospiraceae bacterium]
MKLWAGRFTKETDSAVNDFNTSLPFDCRMYRQDIEGSLAHAKMLSARGIITEEDERAIREGLKGILSDIEGGRLLFDSEAEDIHMFIESELTNRIKDAGKRLHTARSRNDQVALDLRLYLREDTNRLRARIRELVSVLCDKAHDHADTVMPGYTHLQRAQPVTFGHHLMAWAFMLLRDDGRLSDAFRRMNFSPLGSCALAGTTYPIDREATARDLGFSGPTPNSLDGVADRDFCLELMSAVSILMVHLSRFCEEIILWCSSEFGFIELDDAFATGSSIMPQKKNPDVAELVRGKAGRVIGRLTGLLAVMKGLPLAYNKDMQEDKEAVFDSFDTAFSCLSAFTPMIKTMTAREDNMRAAVGKGFLNATDCADYLTGKGLPFRDAYKITGQLVGECLARGCSLEELPLET